MLVALIVAAEISFWVLLLGGLTARYVLRRPRLSSVLLVATPLVDVVLLVFTVVDLRGGATASLAHALAAVYIGVSVAFGHSMIAWADVRFAHRFAGGPAPRRAPRSGPARAARERRGWLRHVMAWAIGVGLLLGGVVAVGDAGRTQALIQTAGVWTLVLGADFLVSFSYTLFPVRRGTYAATTGEEVDARPGHESPDRPSRPAPSPARHAAGGGGPRVR